MLCPLGSMAGNWAQPPRKKGQMEAIQKWNAHAHKAIGGGFSTRKRISNCPCPVDIVPPIPNAFLDLPLKRSMRSRTPTEQRADFLVETCLSRSNRRECRSYSSRANGRQLLEVFAGVDSIFQTIPAQSAWCGRRFLPLGPIVDADPLARRRRYLLDIHTSISLRRGGIDRDRGFAFCG